MGALVGGLVGGLVGALVGYFLNVPHINNRPLKPSLSYAEGLGGGWKAESWAVVKAY